jgi:hypothetical protein
MGRHNTQCNQILYSQGSSCFCGGDWAARTAPEGFYQYQVQQEEIISCGMMHVILELDSPGATLATDGGHAWPAIAKRFGQNHIEDTWHNEQNRDKKMNNLFKDKKKKFDKLKNKCCMAFMSKRS